MKFIISRQLPLVFRRRVLSSNLLYGKISPDSSESVYEIIDRAISPGNSKLFSGNHTFGNLSGKTFNDTATPDASDIPEFYNKLKTLNTHLDNGSWALIIEDYKVKYVLYSDSENDKYVGIYPLTDDYDSYDKSKNIKIKWDEIASAP